MPLIFGAEFPLVEADAVATSLLSLAVRSKKYAFPAATDLSGDPDMVGAMLATEPT